LCPEVFELLPEGKSHVIKEDATCDLDAAVSSCPVQAISIVER
jgi:ferredoxin